jgi:hypothetical protein
VEAAAEAAVALIPAGVAAVAMLAVAEVTAALAGGTVFLAVPLAGADFRAPT